MLLQRNFDLSGNLREGCHAVTFAARLMAAWMR